MQKQKQKHKKQKQKQKRNRIKICRPLPWPASKKEAEAEADVVALPAAPIVANCHEPIHLLLLCLFFASLRFVSSPSIPGVCVMRSILRIRRIERAEFWLNAQHFCVTMFR